MSGGRATERAWVRTGLRRQVRPAARAFPLRRAGAVRGRPGVGWQVDLVEPLAGQDT